MKRNQATVLIAGSESEARVLAVFTPGATVAATPEDAIAAIDNQPNGFDVIVSSATLPDGSKARELINYADRRTPRVPSVLLYSAASDTLAAEKNAIPGAQTILIPTAPSDYKDQLWDIIQQRR